MIKNADVAEEVPEDGRINDLALHANRVEDPTAHHLH
jgi:hypothetical protein